MGNKQRRQRKWKREINNNSSESGIRKSAKEEM